MRILTRYVVGETIKLTALGVVALTALLSVSMAAKEAIRLGMPMWVVVQAMPYFIIEMLGYAMPASVLYAVCSVFGRMAASNELTAVKSLGGSPARLIEPVLLLAMAMSCGAVITYDLTATWGRPGVSRLLAESAAEVALGVLRTQRSVELPWGSVAVSGVRDGALLQPCIRMKEGGGRPETLLCAASGRLESDVTGMRLVLHDIEAEIAGQGAASHPGRFEIPLPVGPHQRPLHRDWLAISEIPDRLRGLRDEATALRCDAVDCDTTRARLDHVDWKIARLGAEPYRRWANGFSCVAFTLVGIPLALMRRNSDAISTFFVAFLPILVVFYPLLMTSEELACSGHCPGFVFWTPNAVLASTGVVLLYRALRR